jgi:hypothetical protein
MPAPSASARATEPAETASAACTLSMWWSAASPHARPTARCALVSSAGHPWPAVRGRACQSLAPAEEETGCVLQMMMVETLGPHSGGCSRSLTAARVASMAMHGIPSFRSLRSIRPRCFFRFKQAGADEGPIVNLARKLRGQTRCCSHNCEHDRAKNRNQAWDGDSLSEEESYCEHPQQ